ncbi:sigma-70 family RNA polymerase sigma factor [Nakamurella sp. YIM 132087]|uniref:Sigma-70 family RNA polymerase sigma factor n=1 Tax=Nakamurella alba TaxID=2665158 RepID=A0A7K1FLC8_9ACTN|nr:sigma-70 family RNA polymerase sigma factor [Nakamurella alba]MTD14952.1 sigma-70 family RNA polymerase sigma factor [Nakamurella alba]
MNDECIRAAQRETLQELAAARVSGDVRALCVARNNVVLGHLSVATAVARRYRGRGVPIEELVQLARLSLVEAVQRWDPERGEDFVAYLVPTISGVIKRYFRDHLYVVRIPRRLQEVNAVADQVSRDLEQKAGRSPTLRELADAIQTPVSELSEARTARRLVGAGVADQQSGIHDTDTRIDDFLDLQDAVRALSDEERRLLELHYSQGWSQARIAGSLGVSQMHVSRSHRSIIAKLRRRLAG